MAQNRDYSPPISTPPDSPPRTIKQVETNSSTSEWGAIPAVVPRPEGGIPLQRSIVGKTDAN